MKSKKENYEIVKPKEVEELCDVFVLVLNHDEYNEPEGHSIFVKKDFEYAKTLGRRYLNSILYAAIWTNKGLIYVSKMNKKGELEPLNENNR